MYVAKTIMPFVASLLISGSAIPTNKYKFSTIVGFRHPVIALHAWLSSRSCRCVCFDLDHTGVPYSATEQHKTNAVVLIVLAFVHHLELVSFFRRWFRVTTFIFVFCMCSLYRSVMSMVYISI